MLERTPDLRSSWPPRCRAIQGNPQTCKVDVWSLFLTLAFTMNVGEFRGEAIVHTDELKVRAVPEAAGDSDLEPLQGMAMV